MRPVPVWSVVLVASAASLLVWGLAVPLAGVDLVVPDPQGSPGVTIGPALIVATAALATLAAWPVRAHLRLRAGARSATGRPVGWWATCALVLVVSLAGPAGAGSAAAVVVLVLLHVVVGAVVVVGLDPRRTRASDAAPGRKGRTGVAEAASQTGT